MHSCFSVTTGFTSSLYDNHQAEREKILVIKKNTVERMFVRIITLFVCVCVCVYMMIHASHGRFEVVSYMCVAICSRSRQTVNDLAE